MIEEYVTNPEYETYFQKLNGLRPRIAKDLPIEPGMRILDVATGGAFFALEVARRDSTLKVTGVEITESGIRDSKKNIRREGLGDRVKVVEMDATGMNFGPEEFDTAVNFAGLEDIHMTRGRVGVEKTFHEVARVLKPNGFFCLVVMPPEEMETEAQRIEVALFSYICDATWLNAAEYERMLENAGFILVRKETYYTGKKLTAEQAQAEIRYVCKNDPKIYGITTPPFEQVWAKFGRQIEANGLGHYSKVVLMVASKVKGT
ncbi:MAG: methyltransferase domain-containing protein [candidate division Zixibacteria bacterium]|nr:methyltransferase domain-containing protein [candidate division Zixibacteria bacterium]